MEQVISAVPSPDFWKSKRVLVTGHTGFKGSWLIHWLNMLGADMCGVALNPTTKPSLWDALKTDLNIVDIRSDIRSNEWQTKVSSFAPEIAFHLAAQPLVVTGWKDPKQTFDINLMGLVQFLQFITDSHSVKTAVIITSDKVYKLDSTKKPRSEFHPLGGEDPYSASKAAAELILHSWPLSSGKRIASARSGNVIGGGDWAEERLIPDLIRHWRGESKFKLRSPNSIRPWQHVLEPLCGYLLLAEKLSSQNITEKAFNFGPNLVDQVSVKQIVSKVETSLNLGSRLSVHSKSKDNAYDESKFLLIDSKLAESRLKWKSRMGWELAIDMTLAWYRKFYEGINAQRLVVSDINKFVSIASQR